MRVRAAFVCLALVATSACAALASPDARGGSSKLQVVAAENVWGNIAAQLGGARVEVTSLISSPDVDPHAYEPTASDERAIAASDVVIVNGLGYDEWATQAIDANPDSHRRVIDVGALQHLQHGDDPHRWYHPDDVAAVIGAITDAYTRADPEGAADYAAQRSTFESVALAPYHALLDEIRQRFAGTPIGASETVCSGVAEATGLDLVTPRDFLTAVAEGTDPSAADKTTVDEQISTRAIAALVVNGQNATPDVQALEDAARANGIEVVRVTETITPATATFQDWQVDQLRALRDALTRATGR